MIEVLSILMVPINNKINSISSYAVNIDTAVALTANIKKSMAESVEEKMKETTMSVTEKIMQMLVTHSINNSLP
ncbi:hypothetical protein HDV05_007556 [Chytridiales sp. JEL 0842]|nr:hypothetical protein HDV05_007556 [Chytridiales sp. JEL 0842]